MSAMRRIILFKLLIIADLVSVVLCFEGAKVANVLINNNSVLNLLSYINVSRENILILIVLLILWHVVLSACNVYTSQRLFYKKTVVTHLIKPFIVASSFSLIVINASYNHHYSIRFSILFVLFTCLTLTIVRITLKIILGIIRVRGRNLRYALIVGTNPRAIKFARKLKNTPEFGYRIVGFVDDEWKGIECVDHPDIKRLSSLDGISRVLRSNIVDDVFIFLPFQSLYKEAYHIISKCEEQGITVRYDSNMFDLKNSRTRIESFADGSMITIKSGAIDDLTSTIKRCLDAVVSLCALIILLPLLGVIAVAIKATSNGPIIFSQERVGLNKRLFKLYKFRSMIVNAEEMLDKLERDNEVDGPVFKIMKDPRITGVGRILRKTSLDELPQLFNVLKGDMSLVGPRPLPMRDYKGFNEDWHRRRFSVRPGITCLWQVNGRSSIPFEQWMRLDMEYIDKWSLLLDFKVLMKTIPAVIKGRGAA